MNFAGSALGSDSNGGTDAVNVIFNSLMTSSVAMESESLVSDDPNNGLSLAEKNTYTSTFDGRRNFTFL